MADFSVRFYGQTDEKINEFIFKMKAALPEITGHRIEPLKISMNMVLPCALSRCRQVFLEMPAETYESMPGRDDLRLLYQEYSIGDDLKNSGVTGNAEVRRPGMAAHGI